LCTIIRPISSGTLAVKSKKSGVAKVSVISACIETIQVRCGPKRWGRTRSMSGAPAHLNPHGPYIAAVKAPISARLTPCWRMEVPMVTRVKPRGMPSEM
jgi:hypothetical protein